MASSASDSNMSRPASRTSGIISQQKTRSRAQSFSSDRPSTIGHSMMSPPLSVSPEAAFIAASAASQIVTNDHDSHANTWYDQHGIEPSGETALVSNAALQLVNNFLDQLLFNFLSLARSTSLSALRPAVTEVLKPKLAKDAINQADEELREYLGGGDDDDMLQSQLPLSARDWDLELVWKRTRLRCMVYSSLGDMEEEDEDFYMEQEHLDGGDESLGETVSAAVAIFLTSILEFMGEQALVSAGQAAYQRMRFLYDKDRKRASADDGPPPAADRITVEEVDMERVAFDRTIGRLWRAWKKRIRSPFTDVHSLNIQRSTSLDFSHHGPVAQEPSQGAVESAIVPETIAESKETKDNSNSQTPTPAIESEGEGEVKDERDQPTAKMVQHDAEYWFTTAISVPLPESDADIADILIPGFATYSDDEDFDDDSRHDDERGSQGNDNYARRPKSLVTFPYSSSIVKEGLLTPTLSEPHAVETPPSRKRANSLPTPFTSPCALSYTLPTTKRVKVSTDGEDIAPSDEKGVSSEPALIDQASADGDAADAAPSATSTAVKQKRRPSAVTNVAPTNETAGIKPAGQNVTASIPPADEFETAEEDIDEEIDEFVEEPEILTSSRVSISGRSSSPTVSEHSRPISIATGQIPRSPSVHSPRVIDVTGPRSPAPRSRGSSVDAQEYVPMSPRASNISRASSISATPIVEEGGWSNDHSTGQRSSYTTGKSTRVYTSDSISETEEILPLPSKMQVPAVAEPNTPSALAMSPRSAERFENKKSPFQSPQATSGLVARHATSLSSPARSPKRPPSPPALQTTSGATGTKVTILSSSTSRGTFYSDNKPDPSENALQEAPLTPTAGLSERSTRRMANSGAPSTAMPVLVAGTAAGSSSQSPSPRRDTPPSPARFVDRKSPDVSQEQMARAEARAVIQARALAHTQAKAEAHAQAQAVAVTAAAAARQQSHTSASSTSSGTSKLKPKRASEESTTVRPEDVARNFEELIQSDQTIQYTLTPESMRDIDSSRSIHETSSTAARSRKSEDIRQFGDRSRSSSVNNRQGDLKRAPSELHPGTYDNRPGDTHPNGKLNGPVPRSTSGALSSTGSKPRSSVQARDARVPQESLADFADFIRGTGPPEDSSMRQTALRTATSPGGKAMSNGFRSASSQVPPPKIGVDSSRGSASNSRKRFLARDATIDYKDDNSDLIDFIRRGPPASSQDNPRIPRTVAPFRTTMDSDQMTGAVGGRAVDANLPSLRYSAASTSVTESSMGSSTGLLRQDKASRVAGGGGNGRYANMFDDSDVMLKQKTHRVRDPYALDVSDEEDGEEYNAPRRGGGVNGGRSGRVAPPPMKEESLVDFLSSVPPPSETSPVLFDIPQTRNFLQGPKKKASVPSLMSRFGRSNGTMSPRGLMSFGSSSNSSHVGASSSGGVVGPGPAADQGRSSTATTTGSGSRSRGYIPIQVNIPPGLDKSSTASISSGHASNGSTGSTNRPLAASVGSSGRVAMKKFEPREAQPVPSRATQDLADFFRNSGPPQSFRG